jgi:hypothetical protein
MVMLKHAPILAEDYQKLQVHRFTSPQHRGHETPGGPSAPPRLRGESAFSKNQTDFVLGFHNHLPLELSYYSAQLD